ncbi:helix-turn-helix domain-containing protein [Streptomyces puniciscabiei]|uniref:helix-turn-helix domain-containing protein n=1 Tax=Streptomyces puniciscabiei TaxID=164348 RepID=UPI003329F921
MAQQERARRTRERALELAAEEIAAHGYARTNLQTVADRLGTTKGALYGHFASKEALAEALEREAAERWHTLRATAEAPGAGPEQALHDTMLALARQLEDPRIRAALRLAADSGRRGRGTPNLLEEVRRCLLEQLRSAHRLGRLAPEWRPEVAAQVLLAMVYGAVFAGWTAIGKEPTRWREALWAFLASLRAGGPGPVT